MALTENQRKIVEGIRRAGTLKVIADIERYELTVSVADKTACHEIAVAIQKYFNSLNETQNNGRL